jgi:SAM-dependent methyltransferase
MVDRSSCCRSRKPTPHSRQLAEAAEIQPAEHWNRVYGSKRLDEVSWYRPHLAVSLALIQRTGARTDAPIVDVGAGASTLVDDLLALGYSNLTLLDISEAALTATRERLGAAAAGVTFLAGNVADVALPSHHFQIWHDRAAFHFLVDPDDRRRYVEQVRHTLAPGGWVIIATFGPEGPQRCSGLPTARYGADDLQRVFGEGFRRCEDRVEHHVTPAGVEQQFVYCLLQRE